MDGAGNPSITITGPSEKCKSSSLNITISIPFYDEDELSNTLNQLKTKVFNVKRKRESRYLSNSLPCQKQEEIDNGKKEFPNQINNRSYNLETMLMHKDANEFTNTKEVESYACFVNELKEFSKKTVCESAKCSEILSPISDKIKRKKSGFHKKKRSPSNMSLPDNFNEIEKDSIDQKNSKSNIENGKHCFEKANYNENKGNKNLNATNSKLKEKEIENSLCKIGNQEVLSENIKEVLLNGEDVLDKKNNKISQNKIRKQKQHCADKFGNDGHSKMESFSHDRIFSDLEPKVENLFHSRFNGDQNKGDNKIICDVTYSADMAGKKKCVTLENHNHGKHLNISEANQNERPSEIFNIALKRPEKDKNYLVNNSNIAGPSKNLLVTEESHSEPNGIEFQKPTELEPFLENVEDITDSRTLKNIVKASKINEKISEPEVLETVHQEDNKLTEEKIHKISDDKASCKKKNGLKEISNQNYVQILGDNKQKFKNEKTSSKEKEFSKKKKRNIAECDTKFATIQGNTKGEEVTIENSTIKNKKSTKNNELCKFQQFQDEEALIPLEREDNIEVQSRNCKEKVLDNLIKNNVNDEKEEIMNNNRNGTKKPKQHEVDQKLIVTNIKGSNMKFNDSKKQVTHESNSCMKKRKLKDLHKQASAHCKRLKVEDELLDPELDSIITLRENMCNKSSEKPLKNCRMQHNPITTNTSNLVIAENIQKNIGNSNNILKNEIKSTSMKLETTETIKEDDCITNDSLQLPADKINYKSSLINSTMSNSVDKVNDLLKSEVQVTKKSKANEKVNGESVISSRQTTKKRPNKNISVLLQDEDSSDVEEKDFSNIMNYLKDYAYNKTILNTSDEHKLKACVSDRKKTSSRKKIFNICSSDELSSDSSVGKYAIRLTNNQSIKKKNTSQRKTKQKSDLKTEENNILLNFLNRSKTIEGKYISTDIKLDKADLPLTRNCESKLSLKDKVSNPDSSEGSGNDSFVSVSKTCENRSNKNIHRNDIDKEGKEQINKTNIEAGNSLHNAISKSKPLDVCSDDFKVVPSVRMHTAQLDEDCTLSIRKNNKSNEKHCIATSVKKSNRCNLDSKKEKIGSLPLKNSPIVFNEIVNGDDNTASQENNTTFKKKYKDVQKQNIEKRSIKKGALIYSSTEEDSESNSTNETTLNDIAYKENKTENLKHCMTKQHSTCKAKKDKKNTLKHDKTDKGSKEMILEYIDEALVKRYDTTLKSNKEAENSARSSDDSCSGIKNCISNFETDKESDGECKAKFLEIISHAENEMLNILEENEQLRDLNIKISWDVPISHKIETRISSCPTKKQQQMFKNLDIKIKKGPFTMVEDEIIKKNFKQFCMEHGLEHDPVPFLCLRYGQTAMLKERQRIKFGRYLGRGLENRKLYCIYSRFKILYSTFKKGRFTSEEDAVIMEFMKVISEKGKQFSALSKILNRPRSLIEKRFRILERQSQLLKPHDYPRLVKCLMEITNSDNLQELRDKHISDEQWQKVADKLCSYKKHLKVCWMASLYTKLFHEGPIDVDKIMRKLIEILDRRGEYDYRELNWKELAGHFKYVTHGFLNRLFQKVKDRIVPLKFHSNLRECIRRMKQVYEEDEEIMSPIDNITLNL